LLIALITIASMSPRSCACAVLGRGGSVWTTTSSTRSSVRPLVSYGLTPATSSYNTIPSA